MLTYLPSSDMTPADALTDHILYRKGVLTGIQNRCDAMNNTHAVPVVMPSSTLWKNEVVGTFKTIYYYVTLPLFFHPFFRWPILFAMMVQGYFKVLGKGKLPAVPIIVRAKTFSKLAEQKIRAAGGACLLSA